MAELKRRGALLCEPFKSAVQWVPEDRQVSFDAINYWESKVWDTRGGRVVLAGDAAHPMPPRECLFLLSPFFSPFLIEVVGCFSFRVVLLTEGKKKDRGQGLNHALQDAHNLVSLLTAHLSPGGTPNPTSSSSTASSSSDLAPSLDLYTHEVATRGAQEVSLSHQNALMVLDWQLLEQSPVFKHALDKSPVTDNGDSKAEAQGQGRGESGFEGQSRGVEREVTAIAGA